MYQFIHTFIKKCVVFVVSLGVTFTSFSQAPLKIIIIRHGEKPQTGNNLSCKGFNRSILIPDMIVSKFGIPSFLYVPSVGTDSSSKHARMFQTITPLAIKYNLAINSQFNGKDSSGITEDILKKTGTVLLIWDHKSIIPIIHSLGIKTSLIWSGDDYESIWIVTFKNGNPIFTTDKEGLTPMEICR